MKSRGKWYALAALGIAGAAFVLIAAGGIGENLVYYWTPSDLVAAGPKAFGPTIRLGGQVKTGSIRARSLTLDFDVTDGTAVVHVKSRGVPPQMFREGIGVVVEGTMSESGHFVATRLLVSHGNEYKPPTSAGEAKEMMQHLEELEPRS